MSRPVFSVLGGLLVPRTRCPQRINRYIQHVCLGTIQWDLGQGRPSPTRFDFRKQCWPVSANSTNVRVCSCANEPFAQLCKQAMCNRSGLPNVHLDHLCNYVHTSPVHQNSPPPRLQKMNFGHTIGEYSNEFVAEFHDINSPAPNRLGKTCCWLDLK